VIVDAEKCQRWCFTRCDSLLLLICENSKQTHKILQMLTKFRQTDGRTDGQTDRQTDGQTDKIHSHSKFTYFKRSHEFFFCVKFFFSISLSLLTLSLLTPALLFPTHPTPSIVLLCLINTFSNKIHSHLKSTYFKRSHEYIKFFFPLTPLSNPRSLHSPLLLPALLTHTPSTHSTTQLNSPHHKPTQPPSQP